MIHDSGRQNNVLGREGEGDEPFSSKGGKNCKTGHFRGNWDIMKRRKIIQQTLLLLLFNLGSCNGQ